jgi:hypothetical protein
MTWYNFTFILLLFCSDVGDSPSDHVQEDMDSEVYPSEDGEYFVFAMRREYLINCILVFSLTQH